MALPPSMHGPSMVVDILSAYALAMELKSSHLSSVKFFGFDILQSSRPRGLILLYCIQTPLPSWMRISGSKPLAPLSV